MKTGKFMVLILGWWLLSNSCVKEEISSIEAGVFTWTPDLAIPFGSPEIHMEEYVSQLSEFKPIADTAGQFIDSLMYYNQQFFKNPFVLTNTVSIDFNFSSQTETLDYFTSASFRVNAINRIPASVEIQVYFKTDFSVLFPLFEGGPLILEAAPVNSEGIVTGAYNPRKNDAEFDANKIHMLSQVTSIEIYTRLIIPKTQGIFIQYISDQDVWIQLGGRFKLNVPL
ncbi:MAG: hypothetical protein M0P66_14820 [Salinivirgaceae bacterium]|nr:hypothetical protein [Salinivirgaceae bacterium]